MRLGLVKALVLVSTAWVCGSYLGVAAGREGAQSATANPAPPPPAAFIEAAQSARQSFADGAPSVDVLMDEFVRALSNKDIAALTRLRVNQAEYVDLIVPGMVPVGEPPRQVSEQPKQFFWQMLDTKSRYYGDTLIERFGGRTYRSHELTFSQPTKEYAWYKAHGEVRLDLQGDDDVAYHLLSGWVAEVDGKYKFIGYEWND
jgi:hypothetical protein